MLVLQLLHSMRQCQGQMEPPEELWRQQQQQDPKQLRYLRSTSNCVTSVVLKPCRAC
jgi:hypothetical protein